MKKVVLLPHWVQEILNRHKLPLADVLDFQKVRNLISLQDLATCLAMERFEELCYGSNIADQSSFTLRSAWFDSATPEQRPEITRLDMLGMDSATHRDLLARLFSAESRNERYDKPFITYDLSPAIAAVVVFPGYFVDGVEHSDTSLDLIESVLRVFYAYDPQYVVAQSQLFKQYLQLLSNKTVIV